MDKTTNQEQDNNNSGRGKSRLGVIAIAIVLPLAGGAVWYFMHHSSSVAAQKPKEVPKVRAVMHLDPFVVNLADPEGDRFLRVGMDLGLTHAQDEKKSGQNETPLARTRDTILLILTTRDATGLLTPDGKSKLKDDLTKALQEQVPDLGVQEIYFTEFLVQR